MNTRSDRAGWQEPEEEEEEEGRSFHKGPDFAVNMVTPTLNSKTLTTLFGLHGLSISLSSLVIAWVWYNTTSSSVERPVKPSCTSKLPCLVGSLNLATGGYSRLHS